MKNNLTDLNNHLFAQLERLGNAELTQEQLEHEASRTNSIVDLSQQIISNAKIALDAAELVAKHGVGSWESMLPCEAPKPSPVKIENKEKPLEQKPKIQGIPDYKNGVVR
jgi:hypothetical protein